MAVCGCHGFVTTATGGRGVLRAGLFHHMCPWHMAASVEVRPVWMAGLISPHRAWLA